MVGVCTLAVLLQLVNVNNVLLQRGGNQFTFTPVAFNRDLINNRWDLDRQNGNITNYVVPVTGTYRLTYGAIVAVQNATLNVTAHEFGILQNGNAEADIIPGTRQVAEFLGTAGTEHVGADVMVELNAGDQLFLGFRTNNFTGTIFTPSSTFNAQLIQRT